MTNRSREAQVVEDGHVARGNAIEEWHLYAGAVGAIETSWDQKKVSLSHGIP